MKFPVFLQLVFRVISCIVLLPAAGLAQGGRAWGTYYGGTNFDYGYSTATDAAGNVYVAGLTFSTTGIASGGFQNTFGGTSDAYLVKFDASGNRLWATYYGGSQDDVAYCVTTDAAGNVYITGLTASTSGIASGGFQNSYGGGIRDAFLVKFNSAGVRQWATYYGGTGWDRGYGVTVDAGGNVYLAGWTNSPAGIASGGFQNTLGGADDGFLVKFNSAGARLWATYYGGTGIDDANWVTTDPSGNIYLVGQTQSATSIASGGFQNTYGGGYDGFLAKFDGSGARLWATYYGGSGDDRGYSAVTDAGGNIYFAGNAGTTTGLTSGGYQNTYGGGAHDALLVKFDPSGNRTWATYYGGAQDDDAISVTMDASSNVCLGGFTVSTSGIASGGFQNTFGGGPNDAFVAKFDGNCNLQCATYYGGPGDESGYIGCGVSGDGAGNVYLCGQTASTTAIASGGFQNTYGGGFNDAFLVKLTPCVNTVQVTATSTNILCNGQCTGTANASVSGGTSPFMYNWAPSGGTSASASGLCAGTYTVTVTDANSTTDTAIILITQPAVLNLNLSNTNVNCFGGNNATATAAPSGGTSPYSYAWSNAQTGANVTGLNAGTYTVTVTDANGCTAQQTVTINQPPVITASATSTNTSCGNSTGTATVTASGGTGTLTYNWSPSGGTNANATGLGAGSYTVTITDANGCTQTASVSVGNTNGPSLTANVTANVLCNGGTNGTASAAATGGTAPYSYSWSNGQTNSTASNLTAGTYTVTVTDANGCTSQQMVSITEPSAILISTANTPDTCNSSTGTANANASGGTAPYSYSWNNGATTASINNLTSGTYTVVLTDANGCTQTQSVIVGSTGSATANAGSDITISQGNSTVLNAAGGTSYSWTPASGLSCITCSAPVASPAATTTYTVVVTNANGCTGIDSVTVFVTADQPCSASLLNTLMPTGFSPNNDGNNDRLCLPSNTCITSFKLAIYDRWGERVFETEDPASCWDGSYKGKELNTAVFIYFFEATLSTGESFRQKGNISLIR